MTLMADLIGATKTFVSDRVYADGSVPPNPTLPYITVSLDQFPTTPALSGDARTKAWGRMGQVSLWQQTGAESDSLLRSLRTALNGLRLSRPYLRAVVLYVVRAPEPTPTRVVHDAITIRASELE